MAVVTASWCRIAYPLGVKAPTSAKMETISAEVDLTDTMSANIGCLDDLTHGD